MTDLIDLQTEGRVALYQAIKAASLDWPIYDVLPQGTQPNFLKIGIAETENEGRPGEQIERVTVELIGIYRGEDRNELGDMMFAARQAVDFKRLTTEIAQFSQCRFLGGTISDASKEDGVTYAALSHFEMLGEPL